MSLPRPLHGSRSMAKKVYKILYTAEQIAQLTGFSARTIRRAFTSREIVNSVKPGAGGAKMPARVATETAVKGWCRKRGIEL
jgi:hypothetical protein